MSTRAIRAMVAALALVFAGLVPGLANADTGVGTGTGSGAPKTSTVSYPNQRCTYYANSSGFGSWCGGPLSGPARTWRQKLEGNWPFIPCRNYDIPDGVVLPPPPDGKRWILRVWMRNYDLDAYNGGPDVELEHEIVAVNDEQFDKCKDVGYMDVFWLRFQRQYPTPILVVKPTYVPRVNSAAFFALGEDTTRDEPLNGGRTCAVGSTTCSAYTEVSLAMWNGRQTVSMSARVTQLKIDPGDGNPAFTCTDVTQGYDITKKPDEQVSTCKYTYKRSSASRPDGMYDIKISAFWQVRYCLWTGSACNWQDLGTWEVKSVQKLPVQEVQGIGGGR